VHPWSARNSARDRQVGWQSNERRTLDVSQRHGKPLFLQQAGHLEHRPNDAFFLGDLDVPVAQLDFV